MPDDDMAGTTRRWSKVPLVTALAVRSWAPGPACVWNRRSTSTALPLMCGSSAVRADALLMMSTELVEVPPFSEFGRL